MMSNTLKWSPVAQGEVICCGCSTVARALELAFGDYPITLDNTAVPTLRGFAHVQPNEKAWAVILSAIAEHHEIVIDQEF